ncbi:hypothetical protein ACFSR6_03420 [Pedobacter vanadiisoli]|uniref:Uncharacterized protein n=1 Tax=Pedobacter vanadiisoli TaxID=1761975 RepID=A0ABW5MGD9_9SPHI
MKKPFNTYNGGKAGNGTYQQIINHIPKCDIFIDAMVGNGGIFYNLALPALTHINDIDPAVIAQHDVTRSATIVIKSNVDYRSLIVKYNGNTGIVVGYFDPPYLFEVRKSKKPLYKHEWTKQDHIVFLAAARTADFNVVISHYPCELYDEALKGWHTHDFQSMTRNGLRTERIYMNYPPPVILQDFRYIGKDYRERQRIKRKIERHINRLEAMPVDERTAILSSITVKYSATAAKFITPDHIAAFGDTVPVAENDDKILNEFSDSATPDLTMKPGAEAQAKKTLLAMETFLIDMP